MGLVTESEARADLEYIFDDIRRSMIEGWSKWQGQDEDIKVDLSSSSRAICVHDFTVKKASQYLPEAVVHNLRKLKIFVIDGKYVLRFKKFDTNLKSRNQPSKQVSNFKRQRKLDGINGVCNIEAGYVLNDTETEVESFNLLCPNGNRNYWDIDLTDFKAKGTVELVSPDGEVIDDSEDGLIFTPKRTGEVVPFNKNKK